MHAIFDQGPPPPCPAPFNLAAHVLARAATLPDKIALQILRPTGAERWSYARLEAAVRGTAGGLLAQGLRPGDRVLMRLGNSVDFPIVYLGAIAAGLVPVPTSAQLTVPEISRLAAELAPALIVAAKGVALPDPCPCPVLEGAGLQALRAHAPADYAMGDPERLAYIIYTSGTSGDPRAVMQAHRSVWARRMMLEGWSALQESDRLLHAGAFNWTFTLGTGLLDPWTVGACALIPAEGTAPATLPLLLKRFDATIFAAAPGVYRQMLRGPGALPLPKLRHGLSAGEKLPDALRAAWTAATGTPVYEALGMSEIATYISASPARPAPPGACGYPQIGRRVAVLDAAGDPVAFGQPGIMAVSRRDPGLFLGYRNAPAQTAQRFHGEWFLTGDSVSMAPDGAITTLGRDDDMMNAGGFRVSPLEVERALNAHPDIHESAATEVTVKPGATVIAAFYVPEADRAPDTTELQRFAAGQLARYKQPRLFIAVAELPRNPNGKLQRRALRTAYEASHGPA